MTRVVRAAIVSTLVISVASLVVYAEAPKALALILYIVVMIPLWLIDDLGVIDIGSELNGFFLPTPVGYAIGASIFWVVVFLLVCLIWQGKPNQVGSEH